MNWFAFIWLALLLVFLAMEANTVSMVSAWFAVGSLMAMIASLFHAPIWLQLVIFLAVSTVCLILLRPLTKKYFTPKIVPTNTQALIGTCGLVTTRIDNVEGCGQVKLNGMTWSARSTAEIVISEGTLVKVDRIEGVKAFVSPTTVTSDVH